MTFSYADLLSLTCAEKSSSYAWLTERHVQAIWFEQKYLMSLHTKEGERIEVLSPGIWNTEAGPDFLKAHLRIGSKEWRGDIEVHLSEGSWYHHHHHQDPRYNNVILHLAFWEGIKLERIIKQNGVETPSITLEKQLIHPIKDLLPLIDLDLYPYKRTNTSGKCAEQVFKHLSDQEVKAFFISAARWRLEQKNRYLASRFLTKPLQMAAGIAVALGYKNNAEAFLELFSYLRAHQHRSFDELLVISLGVCGFFEKKFKRRWQPSIYYKELEACWDGIKHEGGPRIKLRLDRIRPLNHPIRRLVYLIKLLKDPVLEKIWPYIWDRWQTRSTWSFKQLRSVLLEQIPIYTDSYWNRHYTFESESKGRFIPLIGEDFKMAVLVNTILPLLYKEIRQTGDPQAFEDFNQFYDSLKGLKSSKVHYLTHRFFGENPRNFFSKAQLEQGGHQLHRDFCQHYEASCLGCPFVEKQWKNPM